MICDLFPGGYRHLFEMDRFNTSFQSLQLRGRFLFANCSFPWNSVPAQSHKSPDIHDILQFWGKFPATTNSRPSRVPNEVATRINSSVFFKNPSI